MRQLPRRTHWTTGTLVFATAVLSVGGCFGGDGVKLGKVAGVVTFDGEPLPNASISFHPEKGRGSFGKTNADGRYELRYMKSMGATLGTHKVTITSKVWAETGRKPGAGQTARSMADAAASQNRDELLPEKYREREKTVLSATVEAGENQFDFDLQSE